MVDFKAKNKLDHSIGSTGGGIFFCMACDGFQCELFISIVIVSRLLTVKVFVLASIIRNSG